MLTNWFSNFLITVADKGNFQFTLKTAVKIYHKNNPNKKLFGEMGVQFKTRNIKIRIRIWSIDPVS